MESLSLSYVTGLTHAFLTSSSDEALLLISPVSSYDAVQEFQTGANQKRLIQII